MTVMAESPVVIVGAGVAGLCCGLHLQERKIPFRIVEASENVGGRIRTDRVNGFLLDRGFQVLLTAYPECKRMLDYHALDLHGFNSGALVYTGTSMQRVADPMRAPLSALPGVFSSVGSLADKLRVLKLRKHVMRGSLQTVLSDAERSTLEELEEFGFSESMIDKFFRPFFGGVFLEDDLSTSSRKFDFIFRMFSEGVAALPWKGMRAIPEQLATRLPAGSITIHKPVSQIDGQSVLLADGEKIQASKIVLAVEQPEAMRLLGREAPRPANGTACLYFDAPKPPVHGPWLVLNGSGLGPVNNICVPSETAPSYAPKERSLVCVSTVGNPPVDDMKLESLVRQQMDGWFGPVNDWRLLKIYRVPFGLPAQPRGALSPIAKPARVNDHVYLCGDHMDTASINGAMLSGRRAADAIAT